MYKGGQTLGYSKNPHKSASGLRTLRLKFGQESTIHVYIRTNFSLTDGNWSYIYKKIIGCQLDQNNLLGCSTK